MKVATDGGNHVFKVQLYLGGLNPNTIRVELYANGMNGGEPVRQQMMHEQESADANGGYIYSVQVPSMRPATDYTARVIPHYDGIAIPLEGAHILWQR
jgi:glycogen phosphorylase